MLYQSKVILKMDTDIFDQAFSHKFAGSHFIRIYHDKEKETSP